MTVHSCSILTNSEYDFVTKRFHKIFNFYMLPKLHKSKGIKEIIEIKLTEYIRIDKDVLTEGRPIVEGSCFSHKWTIQNFTLYHGTCFIFNPTHF